MYNLAPLPLKANLCSPCAKNATEDMTQVCGDNMQHNLQAFLASVVRSNPSDSYYLMGFQGVLIVFLQITYVVSYRNVFFAPTLLRYPGDFIENTFANKTNYCCSDAALARPFCGWGWVNRGQVPEKSGPRNT